jgi:aconitate hydratase
VVIAAITSCTNTSNPAVMLGAGLLARNAVALGLKQQAVGQDLARPGFAGRHRLLKKAGVLDDSKRWASTSSATAARPASATPARCRRKCRRASPMAICRRFGAVGQPQLRRPRASRSEDELPGLAAAGRGLRASPARSTSTSPRAARHRPATAAGVPARHLAEQREIGAMIATIGPDMFAKNYADVFGRRARWNAVQSPRRAKPTLGRPRPTSSNPPYFEGMTMRWPNAIHDIHGARVLGVFGDSITTDHISPAGDIKATSPAGVPAGPRRAAADFNSYGARRGNHDVMVRGTFANIRIKNLMLGGEEGGNTMPRAERRQAVDLRRRDALQTEGTPLVVSPARNTAPARRATGRPRARCCSA